MSDENWVATALRTAWIVFLGTMALAGIAFVQSALNPAANYRTFAAGFAFVALLSLIRIFRLTATEAGIASGAPDRFGLNGAVMDGMTDSMRDAHENPAATGMGERMTREDVLVVAVSVIAAFLVALILPAGWTAPLWLFAAIFAAVVLELADWLRALVAGHRLSQRRRRWAERDTLGKAVYLYARVAGAVLLVVQFRALVDNLA